ncbi:MAG: GNAT family N-acetyltransferase [Oscillospiraceae bacterium]|nr:GNAT family N-acetyltransferase [Oscillospiraceae bacterium]
MVYCTTLPIETERLILRRFVPSDIEAAHKNWASHPEVQLEYGEPVYDTIEKTAGLINGYIAKYEQPNIFRWAIELKENGQCIGQIAYFEVVPHHNFAEIEYCIGTEYQNKGYATEATKAVISFGFEHMKLHKVQICRRSNNPRSGRVIEKCGFHYDGTLRDAIIFDGKYVDRLYYSILESEYKPF